MSYPGLNIYPLRRNVEGGNRVASFLTDSAREVMGLKGDFADAQDAWTYNVYAQHSTVDTQFASELPQQHRHRAVPELLAGHTGFQNGGLRRTHELAGYR